VRTDRSDGRLRLLRGADRAKDQSYMLHMLGQRELSRSRFPVGEMSKAETRAAAGRFGLPVASKPDSQELCFAPSGESRAYLASAAPHLMRDGEVVDTEGRVLAHHGGSAAFTVGQRRGLGISGPEPSYVLEIDAPANRVVVGPGELLARAAAIADRVSWVAGEPPSAVPFEAEVRIRYRGDDVPAVVAPLGDAVRIEFRTPQRGVAPGQSAVVYRGEELLGGGRIVDALR
jgi:tRNA-specific 2-thiouridylase